MPAAGSARKSASRTSLRSAPGAILKVGGSLCRNPRAARALLAALESMATDRTLVVVPGGGRFADEVRRADRRFSLDASHSHWMAVLAMDQSAYLLAHLARRAVLVRRPSEIRPGRLNVLAPSAWLLDEDPLPHSWDVTSDSIAAWVARALRSQQLVLLKSIDGVPGAAPAARQPRASVRVESARAAGTAARLESTDSAASGRIPAGRATTTPIRRRVTRGELGEIVDAHFTRALPAGISCWIVNGRRPERVAALLATGSTYGTEITMRRARPRTRRGPRSAARSRSREEGRRARSRARG